MPVSNDTAIELALWRCASEPMQAPGTIQGNGALMAVDRSTGLISHVSENISAFLNVRVTDVLGKKADAVFSRAVIKAWGLKGASGAGRVKCHDLGVMTIGAQSLWVTTACAGGSKIIAFEAVPKTGRAIPATETCLADIASAETETELFETSVKLLQNATSYDRVMLLQFGVQGHGQVVAEWSVDQASRFEGLVFPEWDIPPQARDLMLKSPYRYIADVAAPLVQVRAADPASAPLDMTHLHLRGTSLLHLEYLRNMGASATLTLNLVMRRRLWGMFAFHHRSPRVPSAELRRDCLRVTRAFTQRLAVLRKLQQEQAVLGLTRALSQSAVQVQSDTLTRLCRAFEADGCLSLREGQLVTQGQIPPDEVSRDLLEQCNWPLGVSAIPDLRGNDPQTNSLLCHGVAAAMIIHLSPDYILALFRKTTSQQVKWAGTPDKKLREDDGRVQLAPRMSFSECTGKVDCHNRPWSPEHVELAQALCVALTGTLKP